MEQSSKVQKHGKVQPLNAILKALADDYSYFFQTPEGVKTKSPFTGHSEALNLFLIQNKWKGPPGGWVCPRGGHGLEPDIKTAARNGKKKSMHKIFIQ